MFGKFFASLKGKSQEESTPSLEQRRKTSRRDCEIEVGAALGRSTFSVTVVEMSVSGLRLRLDTPVKIKNKATLRLTYPEVLPKVDTLTIDAIARWQRIRETDSSQFVGVEFKDPKSLGRSWIKAKMEELGFRPYNLKEQRKQIRVRCKFKASVVVSGTHLDCLVRNIGLGGVFLQLRKPLRAGAALTLSVPSEPGLPAGQYNVVVRHQQHPDPGAPFGHGLSFADLSAEQEEKLSAFLLEQQQVQWETVTWRENIMDEYNFDQTPGEHDDVEIPDLEDILAEDDEG